MTFLSYAQNFEDVMLWRALKHVTDGFYIDVGAQHPDTDSVTRAFYDHGWHGINIEPTTEHFGRLSGARPRDVNLQVAIGTASSGRNFFVIPGTGLSTFNSDVAAKHKSNGWTVEETEVTVMTLAEVCKQYAPADVHFLKIDVEGSEYDVLASADFTTYRPWIVLVEATRPLSQEADHQTWEPLLLAANYRFVWFDGLNRFYVAAERYEELGRHFQAPPNFFDGFLRVADTWLAHRIEEAQIAARAADARAAEGIRLAEARAAAAETRAVESEVRARESEIRAREAEARAEQAAEIAAAMRESIPWRVTKPLRWLLSRMKYGGFRKR